MVLYAEYASERLELCEVTLTRLASLIHTAVDSDSQEEESSGQVLGRFRERINELKRLVLALRVQWQDYIATLEFSQSRQTSYRAGVDRSSGRRGRPRIVIFQEQLLYLRSLSFTWIEIAVVSISRNGTKG